MDPDKIKNVAWMLTVGAGILALAGALPALLGRRQHAAGAMTSGFVAVGGAILFAAVAGAVGLRLTSGTGLRGCALAFGVSALVAPLATVIGALCSDESEQADTAPAPTWSLIPGIFLVGVSLFEMGWFAHRYGIMAQDQWRFWTLGMSFGLAWSVLVLRATRVWGGAEALCGNVSGAALIAVLLGWTVQLSDFHFAAPSNSSWFVLFCGVGILAGWALALVVVAMSPRGLGGLSATVGCALVMAVAVGGVAGSAQANIVREEQLLPVIAAGYLAALLLLPMGSGGKQNARGGPDNLAACSVVLVLMGLGWLGFKLMMGLGVAICAIGFVAAWPASTALGVAAPTRLGMPVPQRFATLAGAFLALLAGFKVFQECASLSIGGIDVSDGNVLAALVAGLTAPVVMESTFGRLPLCQMEARRPDAASTFESLLRLAIVTFLAAIGIVAVQLLGGTASVAAFLLGIGIWLLLAATSVASCGEENGLLTFRSLPVALLTMSMAIAFAPFRDILADVTREQKIQVVGALVAMCALSMIVGALKSRRARHEAPAQSPSGSEGGAVRLDESSAPTSTGGSS